MLTPMAFKIPASFWLYGQKIYVSMVPNLVEEQDVVGEALYRHNVIHLQCNTESVNRPVSHIGVTFFHEMLHMIFSVLDEGELRKNEKLIEGMAQLLHQAFITAEGDA